MTSKTQGSYRRFWMFIKGRSIWELQGRWVQNDKVEISGHVPQGKFEVFELF